MNQQNGVIMMNIEASGCVDLSPVIAKNVLGKMRHYSTTIGADGLIYLLFTEDTHSLKYNYSFEHSYSAVRIIPDWYSGGESMTEYLKLGEFNEKIYDIHSVESRLLLLSRDRRDSVGLILDEDMNLHDRLNFGCEYYDKAIVTDDNTIILGKVEECCNDGEPIRYFDEFGKAGAIKHTPFFYVEAINLDDQGNLWYYAYPDHSFYCTDGRSLKSGGEIYNFAVLPYNKGIVAEVQGVFRLLRFNGQSERVTFTYLDREISYNVCSFRKNRVVLISGNMLYFFEIN